MPPYPFRKHISKLTAAGGLAIITVALSSCGSKNSEPVLKACVDKAASGNALASGQSAEEVHDMIGDEVVDCMKKAGFKHDMADPKCIDDVDFNKACYSTK